MWWQKIDRVRLPLARAVRAHPSPAAADYLTFYRVQEEVTTRTERKGLWGMGRTEPLLYLDLDAAVAAVALRAPRGLVHLLSLLTRAPDQWAEPGTKGGGG